LRAFTKRLVVWSGAVAVGAAMAVPGAARAQDQQEGPGTRVVTVTTFDLPYQYRSKVFPFIRDRVIPSTQLNPNVLNFRVMAHFWGDDAAQVVMVAEYKTFADIDSECGKPCEDYYAAHPAPKEGEDGYDAFVEARDLFNRFYSHHHDEIYTAYMSAAVVEGKMVGHVGPPPAEENGGQ
jgi:hypothetical protein